jgi:hypothetical protein
MNLKKWAQKMADKSPIQHGGLEEFKNVRSRIKDGSAKKVLDQIERSERAYKGWETRRDKIGSEVNNGTEEVGREGISQTE